MEHVGSTHRSEEPVSIWTDTGCGGVPISTIAGQASSAKVDLEKRTINDVNGTIFGIC